MTLRARLTILALVFLCFLGTMVSTNPGLSLSFVAAVIDRAHPAVAVVPPAKLDRTLRSRYARHPLLVDVRLPEEFAVSHLPRAINVPNGGDLAADPRLADLSRTADIVVYCSIGYRSAKAAMALREAGFVNVRNLSGGIFAWVNDGRGVVTPERRGTSTVHRYSAFWGRFLAPEHHAAS